MNARIGRSIDAVLNPKDYLPFTGIASPGLFEQAWQANPMWVMASIAHAAYCEPSAMQPLFARLGATTRFYASRPRDGGIIRGRQAFLASWKDKTVLAFRGTEGAESIRLKTPDALAALTAKWGWTLPESLDTFLATDLLDDLNFTLTPYQKSKVHRGFLAATLDLWPAIEKDLLTLAAKTTMPVFVTGHSLGGAMAVVAGMTYPFAAIVTFGEPRVGRDLHLTLDPAGRHIRYVNGDDPIPRIMPTIYPFEYQHHGELRPIVDQDHGGPNVLYDHSIVNYAEVLQDTPSCAS